MPFPASSSTRLREQEQAVNPLFGNESIRFVAFPAGEINGPGNILAVICRGIVDRDPSVCIPGGVSRIVKQLVICQIHESALNCRGPDPHMMLTKLLVDVPDFFVWTLLMPFSNGFTNRFRVVSTPMGSWCPDAGLGQALFPVCFSDHQLLLLPGTVTYGYIAALLGPGPGCRLAVVQISQISPLPSGSHDGTFPAYNQFHHAVLGHPEVSSDSSFHPPGRWDMKFFGVL